MRALLANIRLVILESAGWKTFFYVLIPIFVGVLSGTFVAEITQNSTLEWSLFYRSKSFYGLCVLTILIYKYFRAVYIHERTVDRFRDVDYCRAYVRSQCLPEAAERYKVLIRTGEIGEFTKAMAEVEKALK
jgi:hypothetical protein